MGTAAVPMGWDVNMAVAYPGPDDPVYLPGRLAIVGPDGDKNAEWGYFDYPGYDGYGSDTRWQADSDIVYRALIAWLTGKWNGANILVLSSNTPSSGDSFNSQFRSGLERMGHTYTGANQANMTSGGAYDGLNFDLVCIQSYTNMPVPYNGQGTRALAWDYFFNNGGNALVSQGSNDWASYGFPWNKLHWQSSHWTTSPPESVDYQNEFNPAPELASSNARTFKVVMTQNSGPGVGLGGDIRPANPAGNYELTADGTYLCHNNTKGGTAILKTCVSGSHPSGGGYEATPLSLVGLWRKD